MLQKLKKRLKNQKGFTLIELLAVIVILGIIAAIAVPAIGGIIQKSRDDAAVSDALQIINAAKIANAAGETGPWDYDGLGEYITNAGDETFSVTVTAGKYSITGHEAAAEVLGIAAADRATTALTEDALVTEAND